jgi:NADH-quinone oxidoreductase subunit C/D
MPIGMSAKCGTCLAFDYDGHPNLYRLVLPPTWEGHALRKEHPARGHRDGTLLPSIDAQTDIQQEALKFKPEEWGMKRASEDSEFMFLNLGPNHPSVHGAFSYSRAT